MRVYCHLYIYMQGVLALSLFVISRLHIVGDTPTPHLVLFFGAKKRTKRNIHPI